MLAIISGVRVVKGIIVETEDVTVFSKNACFSGVNFFFSAKGLENIPTNREEKYRSMNKTRLERDMMYCSLFFVSPFLENCFLNVLR